MKRASKATYKWLRKANKQKNEELEYLRARVKELEAANADQ
jgi:cell division protein FtsB